MHNREIQAMMAELAPVVREYVGSVTAPLIKRIEELEARQPEKGEKGEPGQDGANGRDGVDGKDGQPGIDGKDAPAISVEQVRDAIAPSEGVFSPLKDAIAEYLKLCPPADGKDGDPGRDGVDGRDGKDGAPGEKGADGRDGVGLAGALIDRSGALVVTLTDGTTRELGVVVGADGQKGLDGAPGRDGANGADGRDGADGLGFDDLSVEHDGERGFTLKMQRGDRTKEFHFTVPIVLDKGVWREGEFSKGDYVTWAGSGWIAQRDTSDKPESSDAWRLATKRGRDGKDGKPGDRGPEGPKGKDGRDLTQMTLDGSKY